MNPTIAPSDWRSQFVHYLNIGFTNALERSLGSRTSFGTRPTNISRWGS